MQKIIIALCFLTISYCSFAQAPTCEQREQKLLTAMGGATAGFMYNTYISIGAICDGYVFKAYTEAYSIELLDNQKKLIDNIRKMMKDLIDGNALPAQSDKDYTNSFMDVLTGLKQQAQYFEDFLTDKNDSKKEKYDTRRKDNWKLVSKLMGIE